MSAAAAGRLVAYVDGASRGNPGAAALGVVLEDAAGKEIKTVSLAIGRATNNVAEYFALIIALQEALLAGARELDVYTDSELVAKQFSGEYRIKDEDLKRLGILVRHLARGFRRLTVTHVPRERNTRADAEANRALDTAGGTQLF